MGPEGVGWGLDWVDVVVVVVPAPPFDELHADRSEPAAIAAAP